MKRLLAIDCDPRELAFVVASAAGQIITLESAGIVSLTDLDEMQPLSAVNLGKRLQTALAGQKRTGSKVLTCVDRNALELLEFTVPPATEAELPQLVLTQCTMESPAFADERTVDFVARPGAATEPRRVTAAALARSEVDRINSVCNAAGLAPDRMLFRPFETAALFAKSRQNVNGNSLLVNVIADEVDLIVVDRSGPIFFRTVRLPGRVTDSEAEQRLRHEIRRTLLIAPEGNDATQAIESVYLFGTDAAHQRISQQLASEDGLTAEVLDPFSIFRLSDRWQPPGSGRLIPLLGMLVSETQNARHAFDFMNPRRAPAPPNRKRQIMVAAILTALVGGTVGYNMWDSLAAAETENRKLAEELTELEALVKKTAEKKKVTDAIDDWNSNRVVWLDELRDLSTRFPSGQDMVLQRLSMTPSRRGRASISFQGLAREPKVVTRMENTLRDDRHEVQTPRVEERVQDKFYTWNFETIVSVSAEKGDDENRSNPDQKPSEQTESRKPTPTESSLKKRSAAGRESTAIDQRQK